MIKGKFFLYKEISVSLIIYGIVSLLLLFYFGINTGGEAVKYINEANGLIEGKPFSNGLFNIPYIIYVIIIAFCIKLSISFLFIGILQIVVSAIAAYSLYNLLLNTLDNKRIAFVFFIAFLLCIPVQKWNYFLYTESLHVSFVVIGVCKCISFFMYKTKRKLLTALLLLLLILFTRPVGIIFMVTIIPVLILWLYRNGNKTGSATLSAAAILLTIGLFNSPAVNYINPDSIRRMEIICQVPEANATAPYQEYNREGLGKVYSVIKNEIGIQHFLNAGLKKLRMFFGLCRPYYSSRNNILLMLLYIFYPLALIGIFSKQPEKFYYLKRFSVLYITITAILIFFTCDEWSNRFIAPVFPFILILAAGGSASFIRYIFLKK